MDDILDLLAQMKEIDKPRLKPQTTPESTGSSRLTDKQKFIQQKLKGGFKRK